MNEATEEYTNLLPRLALNHNWRGIPTPDLVCRLEDAIDTRHALIFAKAKGEENDDLIELESAWVKSIQTEIERRSRLEYSGYFETGREVIQTLKDRIPIEDVIEWYTDVFVNKGNWHFRCTIHGEDKHPSGVIYKDECKWHCFVCNQGGDIIDIVERFEGVDKSTAIKKLSRYIGLKLTPIKSTPPERPVERSEFDELKDQVSGLTKYVSSTFTAKKPKDEDLTIVD